MTLPLTPAVAAVRESTGGELIGMGDSRAGLEPVNDCSVREILDFLEGGVCGEPGSSDTPLCNRLLDMSDCLVGLSPPDDC